ncbi:L-amino-acid oxidase-like [Physella acuta]|uniref:L-amino-acid oxidase-like n=1 Tax=Physella acuta TaxID=109671 RepID=UPI0027DCC424|nr:L-amino-acid oxidase-like [Physella acuta]
MFTPGLKIQYFPLHGGERFDNKFYLRGKHLTEDDVTRGDIPYGLNNEEKSNQGRLLRYYLEKLTGYNGTEETREIFLQLQVPDGRFLYQVPFDEAFDMVASPEGKAFIKETLVYESDTASDTSVLTVFVNNLGQNSGDYQMMYVKEQDALPRQLVKTFLESNKRFKLNLNRRLKSLEDVDLVCARKVVLATSKATLQQIEWEVLRCFNNTEKRMINALKALREVPTAQIFMSFPRPWWLHNSSNPTAMTTTDLPFKEALDWGRSDHTGNYILLASYADESKAMRMALLNEVGAPSSFSAPGAGVVSEALITELLKELADAHGIERGVIPDPVDATAQFWTPGQTGGGRVVWRAGYNYDDVTAILQRPSGNDDVFVVGADFSAGYNEGFAESAFETVEKVFPFISGSFK